MAPNPLELVLNVSILDQPIPRPLPCQLSLYLVWWFPDEQRYRYIVVEMADED